ncbi:MAG: flavodoxin FldA [Bacteroides sp.]
MKKIGIFYGSNSGNTQAVAEQIAENLDIAKEEIHDIANTGMDKMSHYDYLLLGSSTWGFGDIQDDWDLLELERLNLSGKKVALFGTGDSSSYSETFCDALGQLAEAIEKTGALLVGNKVNSSDYSFDSSVSEKDGFFCGLAIDEDNEPEKTNARIAEWTKQLHLDFEL